MELLVTSIEIATEQAVIAFIITSGVITLATVMIYKWLHPNHKNGPRVSIKIDKNGKYHYHTEENMSNGKLYYWLKIIFYIAIGIMALLPFHYLMNNR